MNKNIDLINGPIAKSLRQFSFPLAISFVVNIIYAWVDLFFVSKLGEQSVGAVGASERIWFFIFAVGSGFAIGSSVIVSRRIGERNRDAARNIAAQSIVGMLILGIILAVFLYIFKQDILTILGLKGEIKILAIEYFNSLIIGVPFNLMMFQISMIMRSSGNSIYPMQILIGSNIVNAVLTPLLVFGIGPFPRWEVFGAGMGTSIAQICGSIWAFILLTNKFEVFHHLFNKFKLKFDEILKIVKVGFPASLQLIAVSVTGLGLTANANLFGTEILSTYIIGMRIDMFVNMSIFAFGAAIEIVSGQNLGAGQVKRVFDYHKSAIKQLIIVLLPLSISSFFFGKYIGYLFTSNPAVIHHLDVYLKFASLANIPFAIGIISIRVISGAGDYFRSLRVVAIILIFTQLPLAYLSSNYFKSEIGIWASMLFSMFLFALISFYTMSKRKWLSKRV